MCPFTRPFLPFLGYTTCMPLFSRISPAPSPVLNGQYQAGWNSKIKQKIPICSRSCHFTFRRYLLSYKKLQDTAPYSFDSFDCCCFTSAFTSAEDTIFYNFLYLLFNYLKKIFVMNFPFLADSPKLSHPFSSQNLLSMTTSFFVNAPLVFALYLKF